MLYRGHGLNRVATGCTSLRQVVLLCNGMFGSAYQRVKVRRVERCHQVAHEVEACHEVNGDQQGKEGKAVMIGTRAMMIGLRH